MKKIILVIILLLSSSCLLLFLKFQPLYAQAKTCLTDYQQLTSQDCLTFIKQSQSLINKAAFLFNSNQLKQASQLIDDTQDFWPYRDYLLGFRDGGTSYLILLQNNYELHTHGGFFGSYAVINIQNGVPDFRFADIYTPDGQLPGHVEPPAPIQEAFQAGEYRLPNSDWPADFPLAAQTIRWFFVQGKEINPDLLATINFDLIRQIVDLTGPINIPEYQTTVDAGNIYNLLQTKAEVGHFPGSTQKRDVISATANALITKINSLPLSQKLAIVNLFFEELNKQNILINSLDPHFQQTITDKNWSGSLKSISACTHQNCLEETISIVESNLGANKANCCISRQTQHTLRLNDRHLQHTITTTYANSSTAENPIPPLFYGGNYINYIRFYLPQAATDIQVNASPTLPTTLPRYPQPYISTEQPATLNIADVYGFKEVGFFHITQAGNQSSLTLSYSLPYTNQGYYQLHLLKQHGLSTSPQNLDLFGQTFQTDLQTSFSSDKIQIQK